MPKDYCITGAEFLLRRFPFSDNSSHIAFFKIIEGNIVPTSAAFKTKPNEDGLSVNIEELTPNLSEFVQDEAKFKIAKFNASIPLDNGYRCVSDPRSDNTGHALILGNTKQIAKKLAVNCEVISNENISAP
jgi:hypothetical protein